MKIFQSIIAAILLLLGSCEISRAADSYTPNLRIVQMPTGSNDTQWGIKANAAFAMLDQAISQGSLVSVTANDVTLTTANNATDQARSAILAFTGTPGVTRTVTLPNVSKLTWVVNSSNASIIFTAGAGTTVTVTSGGVAMIYTDGLTNVTTQLNMGASTLPNLAAGLGSASTHPSGDFQPATSAVAGNVVTGTGTSIADSGTLLASLAPKVSPSLTTPTMSSPIITGHATMEGVTATGATGTGKFVFDTAPVVGNLSANSVSSPLFQTLTGSVAFSGATPVTMFTLPASSGGYLVSVTINANDSNYNGLGYIGVDSATSTAYNLTPASHSAFVTSGLNIQYTQSGTLGSGTVSWSFIRIQ